MIFYSIYLIQNIVFNTNIYDRLPQEDKAAKLNEFFVGKIISYVTNVSLIIGFLVYLILGKNRLPLGYLFSFIWIILLIGLAASPHINSFYHLEQDDLRLTLSILITIFYALLVTGLLWFMRQVRLKRNLAKYEYYKIHQGK
ncbi:hypothetical protein ACW95P_03465 [Candidatus Mycoplasma pogonae]